MLEGKQKGERLENIFNALHLKKSEFATHIGVPPQRISVMFSEGRNITDQVVQKLDEMGINTKYLFFEDEHNIFKDNAEIYKGREKDAQHGQVSRENAPDYSVDVSDLFEIEVYDIPANANVGSLVSFYDLPFSIKKLGLSMKLNPASLKGIRVNGDSMKDANIRSGAIAIYDIKAKPTNGDVVVAVLNNVILIKSFERNEQGTIELHSAANGIRAIIVNEMDDKLQILGVVRAVLNYF